MDAPRQPCLPTVELLRRLRVAQPEAWAPILAPLCAATRIDTPARLARFLGNTTHETNGFRLLAEDLRYSAKRLTEVWPGRFPDLAAAAPFAHNPEALAEHVYGGRMGNVHPGDAYRFRDHGLLQTTGRDNYARLSLATGRPIQALPEWLRTREGAASSAVSFWDWAGCNALADAEDDAGLRRRINGGLNGLDDVIRRTRQALRFIREMETSP